MIRSADQRWATRVAQLLRDPQPALRAVGGSMVARQDPLQLGGLLALLFCGEDRAIQLAADALRRAYPILGHRIPTSSTNAPREHYDHFDFLRAREQVLFDALRSWLRQGEVGPREVHGLVALQGLIPWLEATLTGEPGEALMRELARRHARRDNRQLTINMTFRCNLGCPYCLNADMDGGDLAPRRWIRFLDWAQEQGVRRVLLCGGEPTVHRDLPSFLHDLRDRGLNTYFATNGLFSDEVLDALSATYVDSLIVHVRDKTDSDLPPHYGERLETNLEGLRQRGIPFSFRYNLYRPGQPFEEVLDLAAASGAGEFHFAVAIRGKQGSNAFVEHQDLGPFMADVLQVVDGCESREVRPRLSKPIPPCLLDEAVAFDLMQREILPALCCIFADGFGQNATVGLDLQVSPCFASDRAVGRLGDFANWAHMGAALRPVILPLLQRPTFERCASCYLYDRGLCQGVCITSKEPS